MAARDLPAMLTHELMATGVADISYIGHSQGTTIGMAFLSSGSALAQHIKVGACWAAASSGARMWFLRPCNSPLTHAISKEPCSSQPTVVSAASQTRQCVPHKPTAVLAAPCVLLCRWRCCLPLLRL